MGYSDEIKATGGTDADVQLSAALEAAEAARSAHVLAGRAMGSILGRPEEWYREMDRLDRAVHAAASALLDAHPRARI